MLPAPGWITDWIVVNQLIVRPSFWGVIAAVFSQFITENMISLKLQRSVFYTSNKAFAYKVCWLHVDVRCDAQKKRWKINTCSVSTCLNRVFTHLRRLRRTRKWPWMLQKTHKTTSGLVERWRRRTQLRLHSPQCLEQEEHLKLDFTPLVFMRVVHCLSSTLSQTR